MKKIYMHTDFAQYFFFHKNKINETNIVLSKMMEYIKKITKSNFIAPTYNFSSHR